MCDEQADFIVEAAMASTSKHFKRPFRYVNHLEIKDHDIFSLLYYPTLQILYISCLLILTYPTQLLRCLPLFKVQV